MPAKHSDEFKRDAVRIALTSGLTRCQVASDLSIGLSTLGKWITSVSDETKISSHDTALLRENERLRKENRILREEREILKGCNIFRGSLTFTHMRFDGCNRSWFTRMETPPFITAPAS